MPSISIVLIPATILLLGVVVLSSWLTIRLLSDGVIGVTIQSKVLYILLLIGWWCATLYALHTFAFVFLLFKKIESTPAAIVYNIPATENLSKNLQKKFAFPAFGGIVTVKGLETLGNSGCNADIVGVTPEQSYSKSILGLSSGIYASTTITVFPARQALFVCAWKHRQEEKTNTCLSNRRAELCEALAHPAVSGKFPEKSHSIFAIRSSRAIVLARSLKTPPTAAVATDKAATSPQHILDLERTVPVRNSARLLERFQPLQVLFCVCVKTDAKIQSTICNLTNRRITQCNKTCKANSPLRSSARISSAPCEPWNTPTPKTLLCPLAKRTHLSLKPSSCGSTMVLRKSSGLAWIIGLKLFEHLQQSAVLYKNSFPCAKQKWTHTKSFFQIGVLFYV